MPLPRRALSLPITAAVLLVLGLLVASSPPSTWPATITAPAAEPDTAHRYPRRIIEYQGRREFEGFGSLPNDLGDLEQQSLKTFLAANPNIIGVWEWTSGTT